MTVINHPMWYEDPWEIELSEVATLSRDGYHYDDTPPGQLADGTSTEGKEDGGWSLVEAIENLFGVVAEGVGAALRGVGEVAGTVWEIVVGGAQALIGGFANLIGAIFGGGDREPLPPILNPIATDLEGALQPFLDNIKKLNEENQATSEEVQELLDQTEGLIEEQKVIVADMGELSEELAKKVNEAAFNTYKQEASQAVQDAVRRLEEVEANIDPTLGQRLDDIADKQGALNESMGSLFEDLQNHTGAFTDLFNEIEKAEESAVGKAADDAKAKADQALADAKTLIESVKTAAATDAENKANQALEDARASIAEVKTAQDKVIAGISEDLTDLMSDTETKLSEYNSALEKTISDSEAALRDDFGDAVTSTITEYVQSTSATTAPTTGWSTTPPTWINGRYVWARTTIIRADGTSTTTSPIVTTGNTGDQGPQGDKGEQGPQGPRGITGDTGTGVDSVKRFYQLASSKPAVPTVQLSPPGWTTEEPAYAGGTDNLYYTDRVIYTDGTYSYSTVQLDSSYQAAREALYKAENPPNIGASALARLPGSGDPVWSTAVRGERLEEADLPPGATEGWKGPSSRQTHATDPRYAWVDVDSSVPYIVRAWIKADEPGTSIIVEMPSETHGQAVETFEFIDPNPGSWAWYNRPLATNDLPTEWGYWHIRAKFREGTKRVRIDRIAWSYGTTRPSATQYIAGFEMYPEIPAQAQVDKATQDAIDALDAASLAIINSRTEYARSSSSQSAPDSGWSTTAPAWVDGEFIWVRSTFTYGDGSVSVTDPVVMTGPTGAQGEKGDKGETGAKGATGSDGIPGKAGADGSDGVGIASTTISYAKSSSGTTAPSSGWGSSVPSTTAGDYVWTRTVWTYTDGKSETGYVVGKIGDKGATGSDGIPGKAGADGSDGVGITGTTVTYAQTTSGTVAPTSGWTAAVPSPIAGRYVWTKTVWTYSDGTSETGYSVGKIGDTGARGATGSTGAKGDKGDTGEKGDTGVGVRSILRRYQRATSKPSAPTTLSPSNDWVADEPAFRDDGTSLYYTDRVQYTDGSFSWSPVQLDSTYESYRQAHEESSTALSEAEKAVDWLKNPVEIGSSLITIDPETREPHWFNGTENSTLKTPDGDDDTRYIDSGGPKNTAPNGPKVAVDPTITYRVSFWAYADDPGSKIFIELRDQDNRHAVKSGSIGGGSNYLANSLSMPTSWTKFEGSLELEPGVRTMSVHTIYWNHTSGIPTTQRIGGFKLFPEVPTQADVDDAQNRAISAGARLDDLYAGKFEENTEFWRKQNEWNKGVEDLAILNGEVDDAQQDILDIHAGQIADTSFLATTNSAAIEAQQNVLDLQAGRLDNFASLSEAHQKALEAHGDMLDLQEGRLDDFQTLADMQDKVNQDNEALWESQLNWNELQTEWVEGLNDWRATNQAADDAQSEAIKANADLLYWLNPPQQLLPTTVEKQHGNWKDIPEWANIAGDTSSFTPVQASGPDWEGMLYGINQAVSYLDSDVTLLPYPASRYVIDETRHSDRIFRYEFYYQSGTPGTALVMYLSDQNNSTTNVVEWNRPDRTEDVTYSSNHDNHLWWASSMPAGVNKFSGTLKLSDHVTEFRTASFFLNHRHGNQTRVSNLGLYGLRIFPNVVTQEELNRSNAALWSDATDFMERQAQINKLQEETDRLQDEMDERTRQQMEDMAASIDEIRQYTSRVFWISGSTSAGRQYGGGASDDFVVYGNYDNYDIQAKGGWTGEFIFNGRTHATGRDEYDEPVLYQGNVGTTTRWTVSGDNIQRAPAYIQYWKRNENAMVLNGSRGSYLPGNGWYTNSLFTHTIKETGSYAVYYSVKWEGATYLDFYGIRVRRGSTTIASHGPVDKVGPVTPLGNGQKTMSVSLSRRTLYAGDSITFQTYTASGPAPMTSAQRRVLSSEARIVRLS